MPAGLETVTKSALGRFQDSLDFCAGHEVEGARSVLLQGQNLSLKDR